MKGKQNAYSLQQNKKFVLDKGYSLRNGKKSYQKERNKFDKGNEQKTSKKE